MFLGKNKASILIIVKLIIISWKIPISFNCHILLCLGTWCCAPGMGLTETFTTSLEVMWFVNLLSWRRSQIYLRTTEHWLVQIIFHCPFLNRRPIEDMIEQLIWCEYDVQNIQWNSKKLSSFFFLITIIMILFCYIVQLFVKPVSEVCEIPSLSVQRVSPCWKNRLALTSIT